MDNNTEFFIGNYKRRDKTSLFLTIYLYKFFFSTQKRTDSAIVAESILSKATKFLADDFSSVLCVEIIPELLASNRVALLVGVNVSVDYAAVVFVAFVAHFVQHIAHWSGAI